VVIGGTGTFIAMSLVQWAGAVKGTAAGFGIYAIVSSYSPTVIIDSMRTSLYHQTDFGTAYALKIMMNNSYVLEYPTSHVFRPSLLPPDIH